MGNFKSKKGLTLVEVIISIAIIGIIATAFLNLFGNSFVSIASFGRKSEAVLGASDVLERVYVEESYENESKLQEKLEEIKSDVENNPNYELLYLISDNTGEDSLSVGSDKIEGYNLTVSFNSGNIEEELKTFVLKTPEDKKDES